MQDRVFYSICFGIILAFGVFKVIIFPIRPPLSLENNLQENFILKGKLVDEPDRRETSQKLVLKLSLNDIETKVLVTTSLGVEYKYGDTLTLSGKLEKPNNFRTDTGKEFDYINYLAKDGIFYLVSYPDIDIVSRDDGNKIKAFLFGIKNKFLEKINYAIVGNESLLISGLILGEKASFSKDLRQEFIDTGTIHIIALSGYNITIVAEWLMRVFKFLGFNLSIAFGVLGIVLFILMTGASSTGVRAGVMAVLALIARATGRNYDIGRALILTGTIMVMLNPMILLYDVSFQLSFLATIAVIYVSPRTDKYFNWVTKRFGLRDIISVTFATYIFVLPFILYKMGNLSIVALPTNFLILPFIPMTMGFGFLTGFIGLLFPFLSLLFGYVATLFLKYELGIIHIFANLPFASFSVSNFPLILTILIYACFIYKIFWRSIKKMFFVSS